MVRPFRSVARVLQWFKASGHRLFEAPQDVVLKSAPPMTAEEWIAMDLPTGEQFRYLFNKLASSRTTPQRMRDVELLIHGRRQRPKDRCWESLYKQKLIESWEKKYSHEIHRPEGD